MNVNESIEQMSLSLNMDKQIIEQNYNMVFSAFKSKNPTFTDEQISDAAFKKLANMLKTVRVYGASGKKFSGFVIGDFGKIDSNRKLMSVLMAKVEEMGPIEAKSKGFLDESGNLLDNRETLATGKTNGNYGKKLVSNMRHNLLVTYRDGESAPKITTFALSDSKLDLNPPLFVSSNFIGALKNDGTLISTNNTSFENNGDSIPYVNILKTIAADKFIPLNNMRKWFDSVKDTKDFFRFAITEANVISISPTPTQYDSRSMYIDDPLLESDDGSILCWVPEKMVNFGVTSRLLLIVSPRIRQPKDTPQGRTEESFELNVLGVYPINNVSPNIKIDDKDANKFLLTG